MPHLLVAGTTGSGKSVGLNCILLSLLYRMTPAECRLILIDPKVLELKSYDEIPHLLSPVVTEPPKAVRSLKWAVEEMERRYRMMSEISVRNLASFNEKVRSHAAKGKPLGRRIQIGFDPETGEEMFEENQLDYEVLPQIVLIVDELADLMVTVGKEIEVLIQRLSQKSRAAGIHLIMATQRPSVDVITGVIKANLPTRISFAVTSRIDSRTILGEQGAEQLLGKGDMLYKPNTDPIKRVHGPFVSDEEVEAVAEFWRGQGKPDYVDAVTEEPEDGGFGFEDIDAASDNPEERKYRQVCQLVFENQKVSVSWLQRQMGVGYNTAAKWVERMEGDGFVGPANHVGPPRHLPGRERESALNAHEFLAKWRHAELKERSASQSHFNDLCALLGVLDPVSADPKGDWFTFEKGASKTSGGNGWADVWRRECFGWEYKGRHANLDKAYAQLLQYSTGMENPPLLIVSDMSRIVIRTNWTNSVQETHEIALEDLADATVRDKLRAAFTDPEAFRPAKSRQELTEETAAEFIGLAQRLRDRGHEAHDVAHFVNQLIFCMFAEDVGLLPDHLFTKMLTASRARPERFQGNAAKLFGAMAEGGDIDFTPIEWFNGGLFQSDAALPVEATDIDDLLAAARRDWSQIDPSILGTLFERGLDPAKRSQLGAHYTDREKIMMIVRPVVIEPLEAEWAEALAKMTALIEKAPRQTAEKLLRGAELAKRTRAMTEAEAIHAAFIERLAAFRVLDPACGSGNFLYVALKALKDIEHRANLDAEALGLPRGFPRTGPENVLGIELNPYAAELARVSVWIGEIQWMRRNGFDAAKNPILRPLDTIECRDAILAWREAGPDEATPHHRPAPAAPPQPLPTSSPRPPSRGPAASSDAEESWTPDQVRGDEENAPGLIPVRADWPEADVVIGNPPFLGGKRLREELGDTYVNQLFSTYRGMVPQEADLVCYWVAKGWRQIGGAVQRVGFVTTNSVRGGANRRVLEPIADADALFAAWPDEAWTVEGAAVRVSMLAFGKGNAVEPKLAGHPVERINADLTSATFDLTKAARLAENASVAFMGDTKGGAFDILGDLAREWLKLPLNPNGSPNSEVLRPWMNGMDVTRRSGDKWIIDFGWSIDEAEAALFEVPFAHIEQNVKPVRLKNKRASYASFWWRHVEARQGMWDRLKGLARYPVTPTVAKHRLFAWLDEAVCPDHQLIAIARDDDTSFGILHSRFHELWSLRMGTFLGKGNDPRYTPSTTFETFPFPEGLTPNIPAADYADDLRAQAIAVAAARLNELREAWLNPPALVDRVPEVVEGYPDRILPKDEAAAKELKKRTLTNLYNARPAWLDHAHRALDEAVAEAYGWGEDWRAGALTDDEMLARLFALNQQRAAAQG